MIEAAPFRWYRLLRKWLYWKREKDWWDLPQDVRQRIELERDSDQKIISGWDDEQFMGEFT